MFKEDGRFKPADEKEVASTRGKEFYCALCGYKETKTNVEFSYQPRCPKCNKGLMVEVLG